MNIDKWVGKINWLDSTSFTNLKTECTKAVNPTPALYLPTFLPGRKKMRTEWYELTIDFGTNGP